MAHLTPVVDPLGFECPRCAAAVEAPFYGPCTWCVSELRATQALDTKFAVAADYVPKMNVVPNAVASKD